MNRRGRSIAAWLLVAGVIVSAIALWTFRRQLAEGWHVLRLRSGDEDTRQAALARLTDIGGDLSVPGVLGVLREDDASWGLRSRSAEVLVELFPRLSRRRQEDVGAGLREAALAEIIGYGELLAVGPRCPGLFPRLREDVISRSVLRTAAVRILFEGWPASREEIVRYAVEASAADLLELMRSLLERRAWEEERSTVIASWSRQPDPAVIEPARFLATRHERPEVRAIALSFALFTPSNGEEVNLDLLRRVYDNDLDPLPRRAALRIAGCLGPHASSLDLPRLLGEEKDPELRTEAIQARDLWSLQLDASKAKAIELWDGIAVDHLIQGFSRPPPQPWTDAELGILESILMTEREPRLRDAASLALAARHRAFIETPEGIAGAPARLDLVVHEWGVWRDGGGALVSTKAIQELPGFVRRSFSRVEEILQVGHGFRVLKPVVFFYSARPVSVLFRVDFPMGRPWTFYPEVTDYTAVSSELVEDWEEREALHPPWLRAARTMASEEERTRSDRGEAELRLRYASASWLLGQRPWGDSVGLEWCGLRVGYPPEIEEALEPADDPPWWAFLRDVPSTPVASRGDTEKFVFYDGAVGTPSPVGIAWEDATRRALLLRLSTGRLPAVFVIEKSSRGLRGKALGPLPREDGDSRTALVDLDLEDNGLLTSFDEALRAGGLTEAEATSLVRTWTPEFFEAEGLRVITVLPRDVYDTILPLRIVPVPGEIVRVGLIWRECDDLGIGF